jgi:hypothetical protein
MTKLTEADVALTVALVLVANERPLTLEEIGVALDGAGYRVPPRDTMRVLNQGPFRCWDGKWILAMVHDA